jgi:hypothetical protein
MTLLIKHEKSAHPGRKFQGDLFHYVNVYETYTNTGRVLIDVQIYMKIKSVCSYVYCM